MGFSDFLHLKDKLSTIKNIVGFEFPSCPVAYAASICAIQPPSFSGVYFRWQCYPVSCVCVCVCVCVCCLLYTSDAADE